jgi:hypothetical protein
LASACAVCFIGSASIPRTEIDVTDAAGEPVKDFPLRVELGGGVTAVIDARETVFHPLGSIEPQKNLRQICVRVFEMSTEVTGRASISYKFNEKQPSNFKMRYFGAEHVPPVNINVIPLKPLPKGS